MSRDCLGPPSVLLYAVVVLLLMIIVSTTMLIKLLPVFENNGEPSTCLCPGIEISALVSLEWGDAISFYLFFFIPDGLYNGNSNILNMTCDFMTLTSLPHFSMQTIHKRSHHKFLVCTKI